MNILFIGNSFTQRNNLPGLIAKMAEARGHEFAHTLISAGGASLRQHWNGGKAPRAIETGGYDHVVLQEQSTLPVKNAERFKENVRLFDPAIKAAGATTVLYLTWARLNMPAPATQQALTDAYTSIGSELGATVVPAGEAWRRFLAKHREPVLHDKDQSHPALAGSYLAACVFYATLFDDNPVGIDAEVKGLSAEHRTLLQTVAWETCKAKG